MGIITMSLDDNIENLIRKAAARKYGHRKGAIKSFIEEATQEYLKNEKISSSREDEIAAIEIARMEKGYNIGYKPMKRAEMWGL